MDVFMLILELVGTVAFAISGAMTGLRKGMDIFGVAILGLTTAVGGGVLRDILLGSLPPAMFQDPIYAVVAVATSILIFVPRIRRLLTANQRLYALLMLLTDTVGLGICAVVGVKAAFLSGHTSRFLAVFVGTITGVGGGVLRDVFSGDTPYIFRKHIYACAAIAGALACALLWKPLGSTWAMLTGCVLVLAIRLLAAHYRWSLPKAHPDEPEG